MATREEMSASAVARLRRGRVLAAAISLTFLALTALTVAMGSDPFTVLGAIMRGAFGTPFSVGQVITVGSVLLLTGLAAAIPFSAKLWNVGGEGQLFMGAVAAIAVGLTVGPVPGVLPLALLAGAAAGAVWALIPGLLRALLGANEMIISLLLNFVAIFAAAYVINQVFPSTSGESTPPVDRDARLPVLWAGAGVNLGIVIAAVAVVLCWLVMSRTRLGFAIRATGMNASAANLAGFDARRTTIATFAIAGSCAGLAGALTVLGASGTLSLGISANYGFLGVAVALVAGLRVMWLPLSAGLFAVLTVGSNSLQVTVGLPFSLGIVVIGVLVLSLLATRAIRLGR